MAIWPAMRLEMPLIHCVRVDEKKVEVAMTLTMQQVRRCTSHEYEFHTCTRFMPRKFIWEPRIRVCEPAGAREHIRGWRYDSRAPSHKVVLFVYPLSAIFSVA